MIFCKISLILDKIMVMLINLNSYRYQWIAEWDIIIECRKYFLRLDSRPETLKPHNFSNIYAVICFVVPLNEKKYPVLCFRFSVKISLFALLKWTIESNSTWVNLNSFLEKKHTYSSWVDFSRLKKIQIMHSNLSYLRKFKYHKK